MKLFWPIILSSFAALAMEQRPSFDLEKIKELPQPLQKQIFVYWSHKKNPLHELFRLDWIMPNTVTDQMIDAMVEKFDPLQQIQSISGLVEDTAKSDRIAVFRERILTSFHKKYLKEVQDNFFNVAELLPHRLLSNHQKAKLFIAQELPQCDYSQFRAIVSLYTYMTYATDGDKFLKIMPPTLQDFDKFEDKYCSRLYVLSAHILSFYGRRRFRNLHEMHERYEALRAGVIGINLDGTLNITTETLNAKKLDSKRLIEYENKKERNFPHI